MIVNSEFSIFKLLDRQLNGIILRSYAQRRLKAVHFLCSDYFVITAFHRLRIPHQIRQGRHGFQLGKPSYGVLIAELHEYFQFETLCVSNHTACRFAEKTPFFRSLLAGRRCAAALQLAFFKSNLLKAGIRAIRPLPICIRELLFPGLAARNPGKAVFRAGRRLSGINRAPLLHVRQTLPQALVLSGQRLRLRLSCRFRRHTRRGRRFRGGRNAGDCAVDGSGSSIYTFFSSGTNCGKSSSRERRCSSIVDRMGS